MEKKKKLIMHAFYNRYFRVAQLCITLSACARHLTEESHRRHAKVTVTPESDRECMRLSCDVWKFRAHLETSSVGHF